MAKLFILFALFVVGEAKFGNVVFDLFGNIYKVTLPQQGTTPVTLQVSAGLKTAQPAFNSLDFLKIFDPAATTAPIIQNPLSFLDILKPKDPASGASAIPGAIPITLPAYTTPNVSGVSTPLNSTSDLPSVSPPASSDAPTVPGDLTTTSPGVTPTALHNTPDLPGISTPSIGATDVPSASSPVIPDITKAPGFGDLSTNSPATTPCALPTTPSIGSSDVPSVSPPAPSSSPKVPGLDDLTSKPPGSIPNTVPTTPDLPTTPIPSIGSSDVPSVSQNASTGTPKVLGIDELGSKPPGSIPNTVPATPDLPTTPIPSIGSSDVPSVSQNASTGTPKVPGIDELGSKPPGSIPNTVPTTPDLSKTLIPSIGSPDEPSILPPASTGTPKVPGIDELSSKLPGSIPNTVPTTPDLLKTSIPSIDSPDAPSVLPPASTGIPKVPGIDELGSKPPGSIPNTVPTTLDLSKTLIPSIGSPDAPSVLPPAPTGIPKVPGIDDLSSKLPGSIPNTVPTTLDLSKTLIPSIGSPDAPSVLPPAPTGIPKVPGIDDLSSKLPGSIPNTVPTTPDLLKTSIPSIGSPDAPSGLPPASTGIPKVPGIDDLGSKPPGSIPNTVPTTPCINGTSTLSIGSSDVPSSTKSPGIQSIPGFDGPTQKLPDAPTFKPSSLGEIPNSDSLTPAKGKGDLIGDAINLFSGAAQNPFGRK